MEVAETPQGLALVRIQDERVVEEPSTDDVTALKEEYIRGVPRQLNRRQILEFSNRSRYRKGATKGKGARPCETGARI